MEEFINKVTLQGIAAQTKVYGDIVNISLLICESYVSTDGSAIAQNTWIQVLTSAKNIKGGELVERSQIKVEGKLSSQVYTGLNEELRANLIVKATSIEVL